MAAAYPRYSARKAGPPGAPHHLALPDVALETADIVLTADDFSKLSYAMRMGRRSLPIIKQNLVLALGVIVILVLADFGGSITLPLGVVGHEGSTLLVTLNGLRMLWRK